MPTITAKSFRVDSEFPPLTPGKLRLYSMRFCPYAQRIRLVLAHKNIDHEVVNIDLRSKPAWFFQRNPLGLVPALEQDGTILYESTAVAEYLDDVYGKDKLVPSDPLTKAKDRILLEYFGKITSCYYGLFKKTGDREKHLTDIHKHYQFYEDALAARGTTFYGGEKISMIDLYMWPHIERILAFLVDSEPTVAISKDKYPALNAWAEAMYQVPAVRATMHDSDTHKHYAKTSADGYPDFDYKL